MSNDFKLIKERILSENKLEELLIHMGCENVVLKSNRCEAKLPPKFNSDNTRSVQVKLNDNLNSSIRSRSISDIDIFFLVSYIVFDCKNNEECKNNLSKSKRWICQKLGYDEYLGIRHNSSDIKYDPLKWLKDIKKTRKKIKQNTYENTTFPDDILNQYIMIPHQIYIEEGISLNTQQYFQIGFDMLSNRIIYPIHNQFGEIVSVKGRTIDPDYKKKDVYKFIYLYRFNKIIEWYNWHRALFYILNKKEVIIFEGEKSCWLSTQFGYPNCLAISGDDISEFQVNLIKGTGIETRIIIALDKDKSVDDIRKQAIKFGFARQIYALWDGELQLLSEESKDSPVDRGKEVFDQLYNKSFEYRIT